MRCSYRPGGRATLRARLAGSSRTPLQPVVHVGTGPGRCLRSATRTPCPTALAATPCAARPLGPLGHRRAGTGRRCHTRGRGDAKQVCAGRSSRASAAAAGDAAWREPASPSRATARSSSAKNGLPSERVTMASVSALGRSRRPALRAARQVSRRADRGRAPPPAPERPRASARRRMRSRRGELVRAIGHDHEDRTAGEVMGEEDDEVQRRRVCPVQVLEHEQYRARGGTVGEDARVPRTPATATRPCVVRAPQWPKGLDERLEGQFGADQVDRMPRGGRRSRRRPRAVRAPWPAGTSRSRPRPRRTRRPARPRPGGGQGPLEHVELARAPDADIATGAAMLVSREPTYHRGPRNKASCRMCPPPPPRDHRHRGAEGGRR